MLGQTIAAVATPPGNGGVGIIRISGPDAYTVLQKVFRPRRMPQDGRFAPRYMYLGTVQDAAGNLLDEVLAVYMPAPHSYTGEDVAEIQCHGGYLVCREILAEVLAAGAAPAGPGEFTARAFINGKMSLDQAEAVIDIIEAKSVDALKISERQLSGSLQQQIAEMADNLLDMLAELELMIDYPEETEADDVAQSDRFGGRLHSVQARLNTLLQQAREGRYYRDGVLTAIVGPANAGKSTLLNALLETDRSIVTPIAGTTRDTVEEYYVLRGLPLKLVDTAGIRPTDDLVEQAGIERSRKILADADLILLMLDATASLDDYWRRLISDNLGRPLLLLLNKSDIAADKMADLAAELGVLAPGVPQLILSAKLGDGLEQLKDAVSALLLSQSTGEPLSGLINERQRAALLTAAQALQEAADRNDLFFDADLLSVDLQTAWQALAEISGQAAADDIIERVFSRFCLGK